MQFHIADRRYVLRCAGAAAGAGAEGEDEVEFDDMYETERQLLYVACSRARDRLLVSGVEPASEFLADFATPP
jgi:superfamily I DNA/RNA helicase